MMEFRYIGPRNIRDFSLAEGRQDNAIEQPAVYARSAGLASCLCVFGEKPLDEISDGRGFLTGDLRGRGISTTFDEPEQPPCFLPRRLGCPRRAMLANGDLPKRRAAPCASAIMNDVALRAAALSANTETFYFRVPDHGLAAIGGRLQGVHRPFRDLVSHIRP